MDVPGRVLEAVRLGLALVLVEPGDVLVDFLGDDVEVEALGSLGLLEHEERKAFRCGVGEPLLDRDAIALGLGDLLALVVEEQLVDEVHRRLDSQGLAYLRVERLVRQVILAKHLEVDAQGCPAHAEVGLPLHLHLAAGDGLGDLLAVLVVIGDRAGGGIDALHRHVKDTAGLGGDGKEGAVASPSFLAQCGQHDVHDAVVCGERLHEHRVEHARAIGFCRRHKLVLEAEAIEERAQACVVVMGEAFVCAEGVWHGCQRALEMLAQHVLVGDVVWDLAHAVHVVGERDQACWLVRDFLERATDPACARNLAEGADMRQARWAIACLEQYIGLRLAGSFVLLNAGQDLAGFFKWPGLCGHGQVASGRHGGSLIKSGAKP